VRSRFYARIMVLVAFVLVAAAVGLAAILSYQTQSSLVVYLSRLEELEQFRPQQRTIVRLQAEQLHSALREQDTDAITRIVDTIARSVGREVIVVRNVNEVYLSQLLSRRIVSVDVDPLGVLSATISDPATSSAVHLEVNPLLSIEITQFSPDETNRADLARVYTVPHNVLNTDRGEERLIARITRTVFVVSGCATGAVILLLALILHRILRPILELTQAADSVRNGSAPPHVQPNGPREVAGLVNAFNEMAEEIRATELARRRFLEDVAHELRGPLANLRSQVEAMEDGLMVADSDGLRSLHEEIMLMTRLVNDMEELRDIAVGTLPLSPAPTDPRQLVKDTAGAMASAFKARSIRLDLAPITQTPGITVDVQRMSQVLTNVLRNALQYTPSGGRVTVATDLVRPSPQESPVVRFTVEDNGPGVPDESLDRIFDRFYRTDRSRSRASGGRGLGLTISRSLVEAHHGRIRAENRRPHGLRVVIEIPVG
jgi:signal transduction histidine kinase